MSTVSKIIDLTAELIAIPSVSGEERKVVEFLAEELKSRSWPVELIKVDEDGSNIFVPFGKPAVVFSTHLDVVPAPDELFRPRREGDKLFGRGACDAKGIAATMVAVAEKLVADGYSGFGLLFVVREETIGNGARVAASALSGRGIRYVINGEPTENKLANAHKGIVAVEYRFSGRACHSGYPALGDDANLKLLRVADALRKADFGSDAELGAATLNLAQLSGGVTANIISPAAKLTASVRTVHDNDRVIKLLEQLKGEAEEFEIIYSTPVARMLTLEGFQVSPISFATDIPNLKALGAKCLLYGPGSIHVAHTNHEYIEESSIAEALTAYDRMFHLLSESEELE